MNKLYIALLSAFMILLFFYFRANAQLPVLDVTLYTNENVFYTKNATPLPTTTVLRDAIIDTIDSATVSIDIALYGLNSQAVVDSLIEARNRGVTVRVVGHGEYAIDPVYGYYYGQLQAAIPVVLSDGLGLMHNKFIIVDGQTVLTGSTNYTTTGLYYNFNNLIKIIDSRVASAYTCKFNEMFIDRRFGLNATLSCGGVFDYAGGESVEVIFTPNQGTYYIEEIVSDINTAELIYADVFYLTLNEIGNALRSKLEDSIPVHVIIDENGFNGTGDEVKRLCDLNIGLNVRTSNTGGKNHPKTMLMENSSVKTIWIGSANFSRSATIGSTTYGANDENTLRIKGADVIFDQYVSYFWRVFNELPSFQFCRVTNAENNIPACQDSHDNDHDGYLDEDDFNCREATFKTCQDGIDNDGDSFVDADDYGCWMITRLCPADPPVWMPIQLDGKTLNLRWTALSTDNFLPVYEIYGSKDGEEWHLVLSTTFTNWTVPKDVGTRYRYLRLGDGGCLKPPKSTIIEIEYPFVIGW